MTPYAVVFFCAVRAKWVHAPDTAQLCLLMLQPPDSPYK